jgi:hypothetical protein
MTHWSDLESIGHSAKGPDNNQETGYVSRVSSMVIDENAHELYAADGYGNRRVIVFDTETGKFKCGWGAYGIPLSQIDFQMIRNKSTCWSGMDATM